MMHLVQYNIYCHKIFDIKGFLTIASYEYYNSISETKCEWNLHIRQQLGNVKTSFGKTSKPMLYILSYMLANTSSRVSSLFDVCFDSLCKCQKDFGFLSSPATAKFKCKIESNTSRLTQIRMKHRKKESKQHSLLCKRSLRFLRVWKL